MVYLIQAENPSLAWVRAVEYIFQNGKREGELKSEVLDLIVEVERPLKVDEIIDSILREKLGEKWIESKGAYPIFPREGWDFQHIKWSKSYWTRLTNYRNRVDQLDFVIRRLKEKPRSKQLFCTTFDPKIDIQPFRPFNPSMPCLTALDFKYRCGKLSLFAVFRSHDYGRKAYGNFLGLGRILNAICLKTGLKMGEVICYSRSAHIRMKEYSTIKQILSMVKYSEATPKLLM